MIPIGIMQLRKTVDAAKRIYRIFEYGPNTFYVLDPNGRTVDEFTLVDDDGGGRPGVKRPVRHKLRNPEVPDLARAFASEINAARQRA